MRLRPGTILAAAGAAVALHLAAALLLRGAPLLGTERFGKTVAGVLGRPGLAETPPRDPVRVFLGRAERAPVESPGPKPRLDPMSLRPRPKVASEWPDSDERLDACAGVFAPTAEEAREPLRLGPPAFAFPTLADREVSGDALDLGARAVTRPLPARFLLAHGLKKAAESARPPVKRNNRRAAARLDLPDEVPLPRPLPYWPDPDRPLRVPEVFVDVLELER